MGVTYTTARDLATLAAATIRNHPRLYREYYGRREFTWGRTLGSNQPITQPNRNPLLGRVQGADGLKTGHTAEAGYGFTGSAEQNGRRIVMVVAGLGSFNQRVEESVKFMDWGFRAWQSRPLLTQNERIGEARVQLGSASTVGLVAPRAVGVTYPSGLGQNVRARIVYQGPLKAPIAQGQHVADLVVQAGDMPPQVTPLVAERAVGEAGFFGRIWAGLRYRARHGMTGRFITLEGGEGVGKSTQLKALSEALRRRGLDVIETREPGGSPGAEAIRALLLQGEIERWTAEAEALLFAAARSDHVARTISPALERGAWVVCDRFLDSSIAYQGIVGGVGAEAIRRLHEVGSHGFLPDRTLLLHLDAMDAAARTEVRDAVRGRPLRRPRHRLSRAHQRRVRAARRRGAR